MSDGEELSGRRVVLTGVSRRVGIAFTLARDLAAAGADVLTIGWRAHDAEQPWGADDDTNTGAALRAGLAASAGTIVHEEIDLAAAQAPEQVIDAAVRRFGGVDALIAAHALSPDAAVSEFGSLTAETLDRSFAVDTRAALLLIQAFAAAFDPAGGRRGRVVTFSSGQHRESMPSELPYIAAKAALQQLTVPLATSLTPLGIGIICINPGPVDTGYADDAARAMVAERHPRGRWGEPADLTGTMRWLLGSGSDWLTGQTLDVDGGWTARPPR